MAFSVLLSPIAILDISDYAAFIAQQEGSREPAKRWRAELLRLIESLSENPLRFRTVPELADSHPNLRQVVYHSHRVIYEVRVEEQVVNVARVYHMRREQFLVSDLATDLGAEQAEDSP